MATERLKTVRILEDTKVGEDELKKDGFYAVDYDVADDLVNTRFGVVQTPEEYAAEEAEKRFQKEKEEREALAKLRQRQVIKIQERGELDPTGGFKSIGHFAQAVARACPERHGQPGPELLRWQQMSTSKTYAVEYDDSQGGYLVPPQYASALMQTALETAIVRPRATFIPMETNRVAINAVVDEDHSTNLFGGITIYRPGEDAIKDASKPTYRQVGLTLHKLTGLVGVSEELIEDSPISMEPLLTTLFGEAISFTEDDDFINGTGVGQALGVRVAPCTVSVAQEVGQAVNTVIYQNVINMWSRMHPRSMSKAVWLVNPTVLPWLYRMNMAVGTGGAAVFTPAGGLSTSPYATMMGRPIIPTEKCQAVGTAGDIILADFSQYLIGGKSGQAGIKTASSIHLWFNYDRVAFRFVLRYDGQPWWRVPLQPLHGATLSPFVILDTRV